MNKMDRLHVAGLDPAALRQLFKDTGIPSFRADQVFHWIHNKAVGTFEQMHNVPKNIIEYLSHEYGSPVALTCILERQSTDGTIKFLFQLTDGNTIEAVYIPETDRGTLCVSAQVGCAMNCSFCATGQSGYVRNLSRAEIVSQVNYVRQHTGSLTNIVFMGMGEPFANFEEVMAAIDILNDPAGMNLGQRRITISTCGLVNEIRRFADLNTQINLAISLHAPDNTRRSEIMPVNRRFPIKELLEACKYYLSKTNRRISFEYALIAGFNDSAQDAHDLAKLLKDLLCHCNLIPVNPVGTFGRPDEARINRFKEILEDAGVPVSVRKERGTDIEAACGQLRQVHGK